MFVLAAGTSCYSTTSSYSETCFFFAEHIFSCVNVFITMWVKYINGTAHFNLLTFLCWFFWLQGFGWCGQSSSFWAAAVCATTAAPNTGCSSSNGSTRSTSSLTAKHTTTLLCPSTSVKASTGTWCNLVLTIFQLYFTYTTLWLQRVTVKNNNILLNQFADQFLKYRSRLMHRKQMFINHQNKT